MHNLKYARFPPHKIPE